MDIVDIAKEKITVHVKSLVLEPTSLKSVTLRVQLWTGVENREDFVPKVFGGS